MKKNLINQLKIQLKQKNNKCKVRLDCLTFFVLCAILYIQGGIMDKNTKKKRRRMFIFVPICLLIIGYFIYNVGYYAYTIYTLKKEQIELNKELTDLQTKETALKSEITRLQDPEYIARYARENYLYSKDGEYIIKLDGSDTTISDDQSINYEEYIPYGIGIGLGVIILIAVTHKVRKKNKKKKKKEK